MPKIKTFEEACVKLGVNPADIVPFAEPKNGDQKAVNAFAKLVVINRSLNEDWVPDWDNSSEWKYYPWFYMRSKAAGGPGFSAAATTAIPRFRLSVPASFLKLRN